jgi:hypothetical protein
VAKAIQLYHQCRRTHQSRINILRSLVAFAVVLFRHHPAMPGNNEKSFRKIRLPQPTMPVD